MNASQVAIVGVLIAIGAAVAVQMPEIRRYMKVRKM